VHRYALSALVRAHEELGAARDAEWAGYAVGLIRASAAVAAAGRQGGVDVAMSAAEEEDKVGLDGVLAGLRELEGEYEGELG
jgi:hypothetical protein